MDCSIHHRLKQKQYFWRATLSLRFCRFFLFSQTLILSGAAPSLIPRCKTLPPLISADRKQSLGICHSSPVIAVQSSFSFCSGRIWSHHGGSSHYILSKLSYSSSLRTRTRILSPGCTTNLWSNHWRMGWSWKKSLDRGFLGLLHPGANFVTWTHYR